MRLTTTALLAAVVIVAAGGVVIARNGSGGDNNRCDGPTVVLADMDALAACDFGPDVESVIIEDYDAEVCAELHGRLYDPPAQVLGRNVAEMTCLVEGDAVAALHA